MPWREMGGHDRAQRRLCQLATWAGHNNQPMPSYEGLVLVLSFMLGLQHLAGIWVLSETIGIWNT